MNKLKQILQLLKKPSTWATILALAALGGANVDEAKIKPIMEGVGLAADVVEVVVTGGGS